MTTSAATREIYGKTLLQLGKENPNIVVLGGDLNKSTFIHLFAQEFPDRFYDLGPAEQNMMSIAAGLASSGKTVFASTFAVFGSGRPYDQIRLGISQPHLNVKIVVTHGGLSPGDDGMSAQSIEDLSLICALPGFTVVVPADGPETVRAVQEAASTDGPFFIRLSRSSTPVIHQDDFSFKIGKAELIREGTDATIIACGVMAIVALQASEILARVGIQSRVLNMATLQPIDAEAIEIGARETGAIVTAEEHLRHGGLGSIVAQTLGERFPVPLETVALTGYAESGAPNLLMEKYGLTPEKIAEAVRRAIGRKTTPSGNGRSSS
ncbi:MAG: transketolase C-terminal domain-containing protein [Dehalococcoidia bacterium]|jgi:transketolase|nr:transketolase C-terminal domain-containing protein [Dehalococcoidia bacterium]